MGKEIKVRDKENNTYVLTFTAETVKATEGRGFVLEELDKKPMTMMPLLLEGAFLAKEANRVSPEKVIEIWQNVKDKQGVLQKLIILYNDPIDELFATEGNAEWECNF